MGEETEGIMSKKKDTKVEATAKKKKFIVEGVQLGKQPLKKYAKEIENSLNSISGQGYSIQFFELGAKGTIIMGKLIDDAENEDDKTGSRVAMVSLGSLLGGQSPSSVPTMDFKNPKSVDIINMLNHSLSRAPQDKQSETIEHVAERVLDQLTVEDAHKTIDDIEAFAKKHEETHKSNGEESCGQDKTLLEFSKKLKDKLQLRVQ
jgi:hypothetical protein